MPIRPLHDNVLVTPIETPDTTKGGIFIPTTAKAREQTVEGVVVSTGPGRVLPNGTLVPVALKSGERVLFVKHEGTDLDLGGEKHFMVRESDILCVLES